jgi:MFS family permease
LNLTFTVASVTTNVSALLVGALLDRYGPRVCGYTGSLFLFVGALLMAFGELLPFDAYMLGHFLLAMGGTFIFVPSFHLSNAFPKLQGLVLAFITGAFDASAAVFLLFRIVYDSTSGSFGVREFFLLYLVVPILILASQLFVMPSQSYETKLELAQTEVEAKAPAFVVHDSDDELDDDRELWRVRSLRHDERNKITAEIKDLLGSKKERRKEEKKQEEIREASGVWGALHGLPAWKQMQTPWFVLIVLLTVVQMARMNWYIATVWCKHP